MLHTCTEHVKFILASIVANIVYTRNVKTCDTMNALQQSYLSRILLQCAIPLLCYR